MVYFIVSYVLVIGFREDVLMRFNDSNHEPANTVATRIASLYRQNAEEQVNK